jgi:hypothetical protein
MSDEIVLQRVANKQQTTFPTETIDLPSKGHFYPPNSPLAKGTIEIKMMTAKEEDILTSPNLLKKGLAIDKLLESLIVDKNIKSSDLLIGDKNAVIFAVRRIAYGDNYGPVDITCPKCQASNRLNINLSEIKEKELDETKYEPGTNVFEFTLPYSKSVVKFKLMTDSDEKDIERETAALAKLNNKSSAEVTSRLKKSVIEFDGETEPAKLKSLIDNMQSRDSLALRQYIKEITPDIDATFEFSCKECGAEERAAVPMTVQFFWPDSRV